MKRQRKTPRSCAGFAKRQLTQDGRRPRRKEKTQRLAELLVTVGQPKRKAKYRLRSRLMRILSTPEPHERIHTKMRQHSKQIEAVSGFVNSIHNLHPAQIAEGVKAASALAEQFRSIGLLSEADAKLALDLRACAEAQTIFYDHNTFPQFMADYGQLLEALSVTLGNCINDTSENLRGEGEFDLVVACERATQDIHRIQRNLGITPETNSLSWTNPIGAFLADMPTQGNVISHWEVSRREEAEARKPQPLRKPSIPPPQRGTFPLRVFSAVVPPRFRPLAAAGGIGFLAALIMVSLLALVDRSLARMMLASFLITAFGGITATAATWLARHSIAQRTASPERS